MIGFVITGHGSFPNGILQSVQLIAGDVSQVEVVSFEEDTEKVDEELEDVNTKVDTGFGVVCFADLAGGAPFNVDASIASTIEKVRVIGGINSPMLLSGLFQREQDVDFFVETVLKEGK